MSRKVTSRQLISAFSDHVDGHCNITHQYVKSTRTVYEIKTISVDITIPLTSQNAWVTECFMTDSQGIAYMYVVDIQRSARR